MCRVLPVRWGDSVRSRVTFAMFVAVLGIKPRASYMQLYQLNLLDSSLRLYRILLGPSKSPSKTACGKPPSPCDKLMFRCLVPWSPLCPWLNDPENTRLAFWGLYILICRSSSSSICLSLLSLPLFSPSSPSHSPVSFSHLSLSYLGEKGKESHIY